MMYREMHANHLTARTERARELFPNGTNGEFDLPHRLSTVIEKGRGSRIWDVGGREFIDCSLAFGAVLLGHARPEVDAAVRGRLGRGDNFGAVNDEMLRLADRLVKLLPVAEKVRFVTSGTEAMMYCMRLARAWTARPLLVKFEGAYHGATDAGSASLAVGDSERLPLPTALDGGAAPGLDAGLLVAPFNDADYLSHLMDQHGERIAAVLVEPLHRCIRPRPGFLDTVRELTKRHGCLLVFDEVVTGFRLGLQGAQGHYGVTPDLAAYGKALGNGHPIAVVAGRADIVDLFDERRFGSDRYVWHVSTGGGTALAAAAANAALDIYEAPGFYPALHSTADWLRTRLLGIIKQAGLEGQVLGDGPLLQICLRGGTIRNSRDLAGTSSTREHRLMIEAFRRGVFVNPLGTKIYLSAAHRREDCDAVAERIADALTTALGRTPEAQG